ncbi:MAG: hypothetical protein KGO05_04680, partial [Chloroflexota bacterium]|nr:hypothetical protein [Chloroflexota bacterium]
MADARVDEMMTGMREYLREFAPTDMRLLLWALRQLAHGKPLTQDQVNQRIAALGPAPAEARRALRELTERDARDQIVGAMGLSLNDHPHQITVNGVTLSAWCAMDTLFLPILLRQELTITSPSPVTGAAIQLRVSPERVEEVNPTSTVVSHVILDPRRANLTSVEAVLSAFCDHIHFFSARDEAERWASGREQITILTVEEGFALEQGIWEALLPDLLDHEQV